MCRPKKWQRRFVVKSTILRAAFVLSESRTSKMSEKDSALPNNRKLRVSRGLFQLISRLGAAMLAGVFFSLILFDLLRPRTSIESLSVPNALAQEGFTPQVAAARLRDDIQTYMNGSLKGAEAKIVPESLPLPSDKIESPAPIVLAGNSLDSVSAAIAEFFRLHNHHNVTGEIVLMPGGKCALRLRFDGQRFFDSRRPLPRQNPDGLFVEAVPAVVDRFHPFFVALHLARVDRLKALQETDNIIARLPETDMNVKESYELRGVLYDNLGKIDFAAANFSRAVELDPSSSVAHDGLGVTLGQRGDVKRASAEFTAAIRSDPSNGYARSNMANLLVKVGDCVPHLDESSSLPSLLKNDLPGAEIRGVHDEYLCHEAIEELQTAIRVAPTMYEPHDLLGRIMLRLGLFGDALREYRIVAKLQPGSAYAHVQLAQAYSLSGLHDRALIQYRIALRSHSELADVLEASVGQEFIKVRKPREAESALRSAINSNAKFWQGHSMLGQLLRTEGRITEALAEQRVAEALDPSAALPHRDVAMILLDQGRAQDAKSEVEKAISLSPNVALFHANYGYVLDELRLHKRATDEFRRAVPLDPNDAVWHQNLSSALGMSHDLAGALNEMKIAVGLDPRRLRLRTDLATIEYDTGAFLDAHAELNKVLTLDASYAPAHLLLGRLFESEGLAALALEQYKTAIALDSRKTESYISAARLLRNAGDERQADRLEGQGAKMARLYRQNP